MTEIYPTEVVDLVYKSRATILTMLQKRGYDTKDYDNYTIEDVRRMLEDTSDLNALDIRCKLTDPLIDRLPNVLVRYRFMDKLKNRLHNLFAPPADTSGIFGDGEDEQEPKAKGRKKPHILDGFNRNTDELILIVGEAVGEPFHKAASDAYNKYKTRVSIFYIKNLVKNPLDHVWVPPHDRIPKAEHELLLSRLNTSSKNELPIIKHHEDMIGRILGLYPGDIVHILRDSKTAGISHAYRRCA